MKKFIVANEPDDIVEVISTRELLLYSGDAIDGERPKATVRRLTGVNYDDDEIEVERL